MIVGEERTKLATTQAPGCGGCGNTRGGGGAEHARRAALPRPCRRYVAWRLCAVRPGFVTAYGSRQVGTPPEQQPLAAQRAGAARGEIIEGALRVGSLERPMIRAHDCALTEAGRAGDAVVVVLVAGALSLWGPPGPAAPGSLVLYGTLIMTTASRLCKSTTIVSTDTIDLQLSTIDNRI